MKSAEFTEPEKDPVPEQNQKIEESNKTGSDPVENNVEMLNEEKITAKILPEKISEPA